MILKRPIKRVQMIDNRVLKLNQDVRFKKGEEEGILLNTKTEFVYEASNDILDFIKLFNGENVTGNILSDTQKKFRLSPSEIDQLRELVNELIAQEILL